MLPQFYLACFQSQLSPTQLLTLEILVGMLQFHKNVRIERLAALFPQPILFESRRRSLQKFLALPQLSVALLWFPIIKHLVSTHFKSISPIIVILDRTHWKQNNLFVASLIWEKRAIPIYWQFLPKIGSSNLVEQQALLRPVIREFRGNKIVVVGDRVRSVELANWLQQQNIHFAFRQKKDTYIQQSGEEYQTLESLGLVPGMKIYLAGIKITKKQGFGTFNLAAYWKRKYRGNVPKEGWYILTNLIDLSTALDAFKARNGCDVDVQRL